MVVVQLRYIYENLPAFGLVSADLQEWLMLATKRQASCSRSALSYCKNKKE